MSNLPVVVPTAKSKEDALKTRTMTKPSSNLNLNNNSLNSNNKMKLKVTLMRMKITGTHPNISYSILKCTNMNS